MEQPPPLTPQEMAAAQGSGYHQLGQPQSVKILGIFHLILGAYGLATTAIGTYVAFAGNPFLGLMPKTPEMAAQAQIQAEMQEKVMPATIIGLVMALIITALIIVAGIKLLKKRRDGLKWSNMYAWTSLAGKAVSLVLAFAYTIPMMKEMTSAMSGGAGAMPVAFGSMMVVTTVLSVVVMCSYPILCLILLNRPATKQWFAAQPE
ncbi:hypothetical protein HZ994_11180 [Akkermansiaceae bacterium]|nr:hypothetical protein HZ994_11180 [Akkermansiaceae bacterium]